MIGFMLFAAQHLTNFLAPQVSLYNQEVPQKKITACFIVHKFVQQSL